MIRQVCATAVAVGVAVTLLAGALPHAQQARSLDAYEAKIRWTSYGIPHITASDAGSLGFGEGYAFAQDHLCSLADQVVRARGERARFFGAGEREAHVNSDIATRALRIVELAAEDLAQASAEEQDRLIGYAAGYNAYLERVGPANVAGWCRGAPWVRPITAEDVVARMRLASMALVPMAQMIATAAPPPAATVALAELPDAMTMLSNGWAIGRERSANGGGLLLANPHYPWVGANRFWEKHLTIPGQLDVYGVNLLGVPGVAIGFTRDVAWTHTVSAGERYTAYALQLVPGQPTTYIYDGVQRAMTVRDVEIDVRREDGSLQKVSRRVYFSHHGPVVNFPGLPWTATRAIAIRDANASNNEAIETYTTMARARTVGDVKRAHARPGGFAFVNTIVATRDGRAFYIDGASAPYLSDETLAWWRVESAREGDVNAASARGVILLDGSRSLFEWRDDRRARDPGIVPVELAPQLERPDYVFNANDSYWISHAHQWLTGYSLAHGREGAARSLRTRMNVRLLDDTSPTGAAGADGRFTLDELAATVYANQSMSALLLKDQLVTRCRAAVLNAPEPRTALAPACRVLEQWDGTFNLESGGAVLWREFVTQFRGNDARLFAVPFDRAHPLGTPRDLAPAVGGSDAAIDALERAVDVLTRATLPLDAPLARVQYTERGGRRTPLHGALAGEEGALNLLGYGVNDSTLEPERPPLRALPSSRYLTADGYRVNSGTSFLMAVSLTREGPRARAVLVYGQSGDSQSSHFGDQLELFARRQLRPVLFSEDEIRSALIRTEVATAPRKPR